MPDGGSSGDSGGSNPDSAPSMPSNAFACMAGTCGSGEICCGTGGPFGGGGGGGTTTCQTGSCPMGSSQLCSSAAGCPAPQVCLGLGGGGVGGTGGDTMVCRPPQCTGGSCGSGQVCCTGAGPGMPGTMCQTGPCPMGSRQLCLSAADCPASQVCMGFGGGGVGGTGGGTMICQLPQCTGGSCGSGQVCCTGANLFGAFPTCQMGTSCPRGSFLLCSSSADCPSGEMCGPGSAGDGGTVCAPRLADAGAGGG
jgi:loricrin